VLFGWLAGVIAGPAVLAELGIEEPTTLQVMGAFTERTMAI
jgi:hypothetical protein